MMTNLFSVFDPSTSMFSVSWIMFAITPLILTNKIWLISSTSNKLNKLVITMFKKEVKFALNKTEKSTELMILTVFMSILLMNFLALYPQIFSLTSHLTVTLPLSILFWFSIVSFGWMKNTNHMLSHLLPQGTPIALMSFMVLIELTSNIIRPITLCVRLTANLIAGHLLMSLLGNTLIKMTTTMMVMTMPVSIVLAILESAVACIQAYVFMTLITLYTTETK